MKEFLTTMASIMGVWAFFQSLLVNIIPPEVRFATMKLLTRFFSFFSSYCYFDITEIDGVNTNELYNNVQVYLSASASNSATRLSLTRDINSSSITFGLSTTDRLIDVYNNVTVEWNHVVTERQNQGLTWRPVPDEKRGFTLRVRKADKHIILDSYLEHITTQAEIIRRSCQDRHLFTNSKGGSLERGHPWESVPFKHPSTFDTLAMDPVKKTEIMDDLIDFSNGCEFYERTGRAWKRGYLLYGPPGTGKSSMIAAMANYLGYDIYDLELSEVGSNSELRKLLMKTNSKSIIVIEDIDCSVSFTNRDKDKTSSSIAAKNDIPDMEFGPAEDNNKNSITLSGLLNFTDGLWSCCGSERIFIFTTNHVEKLDPALLRSGRMDMHIHMSYCTFAALKILFKNYLDITELDEDVLREFEKVIDKAEMTPADVSEALIKNRRDKEKAVRELLEAMKAKSQKKKNVVTDDDADEKHQKLN